MLRWNCNRKTTSKQRRLYDVAKRLSKRRRNNVVYTTSIRSFQNDVETIEILNNTREGIVIFCMKTKGNAAIGGQILVPDAGPSANWLN